MKPFSELGEMLKDDPNVVIAKMDATANHPPRHFVYEGFPTIFFAGMSNKVTLPCYIPLIKYNLFSTTQKRSNNREPLNLSLLTCARKSA